MSIVLFLFILTVLNESCRVISCNGIFICSVLKKLNVICFTKHVIFYGTVSNTSFFLDLCNAITPDQIVVFI